MSFKACFKCGVTKPLSEFYAHPLTSDGLLGKCKECTKADSMANRYANIDRVREYDRYRAKLPDRKEKVAEYQRRGREKNPGKDRARRMLNYHLRAGNITRQPCEVCGSIDGIEAHHDDYSRPLNIRWLCFRHHRMEHGQYKDE